MKINHMKHMHTVNINMVRGLFLQKFIITKICHMKISEHENFQIYSPLCTLLCAWCTSVPLTLTHEHTNSCTPQATGTRLGTVIETLIGMMFAIVIAFAYTWLLSLVILSMVPIVLIAGALEVKALTGHTTRNKKALETAGKVLTCTCIIIFMLVRLHDTSKCLIKLVSLNETCLDLIGP